jgi:hypothetical protein
LMNDNPDLLRSIWITPGNSTYPRQPVMKFSYRIQQQMPIYWLKQSVTCCCQWSQATQSGKQSNARRGGRLGTVEWLWEVCNQPWMEHRKDMQKISDSWRHRENMVCDIRERHQNTKRTMRGLCGLSEDSLHTLKTQAWRMTWDRLGSDHPKPRRDYRGNFTYNSAITPTEVGIFAHY